MTSDFYITRTTALHPLDRINRGEQIRDDLPRRRHLFQLEGSKKNTSRVFQPEDIITVDRDETAERRLDLRA